MASETDLIRKIDFFADLDNKIIKNIAEVCIPREYVAGDYIIKQGETGLGMFFVISGKVAVEVDSGGAKTVVRQFKDEDFFGELSIIDNKPRSANVVCLVDTKCLLLTRDSFSKLMNRYPEIAILLAKALAERLRATTESMTKQNITIGSAPQAGPSQPASRSAGGSQASGAAQGPKATQAPAAPQESGAANPPAQEKNGASTKDKIRDSLVDLFSRFYTMKAMTRFSVALVGCPVRVQAERERTHVAQGSAGEVKIVVFPASKRQTLRIDATDDGGFAATVLRPTPRRSSSPYCAIQFAGRVKAGESLRLCVPARLGDQIRLQISHRLLTQGREGAARGIAATNGRDARSRVPTDN